jgi:mannose-6-phosphate isomerase-like protein (cupin superfamily)
VSYPDPRYLGEPGLTNATLRRADHDPEVRYPSGGAAHYLATGASTGGQFGLYRWEMAAAQGGPGPHFHRTISESFYVLSGSIQLFDGTDWIDGNPGDFLFVPEGGLHGFRNASGAPASMLILFAPGAPREAYFETTAQLAGGLTLSDDEKTAFYIRHDTYWR